MLEQTRLDYLQAMGICQWMPRQPLPHAPQPRWLPAESTQHHSHEEVEQLAQSHHIPPVMAAELLAVGDAAAKVAESSPLKEATTTAEPAPRSASVPAIPAEASADLTPPRFELHFVRIGQRGLWVCSDSAELDRMMRFAYRVMLGMRQPQDMMPAPLSFRWPFIESSHQDQSTPVALQALSAQWQYFASQGVEYLVAFGEAAHQWLPQAGGELTFYAPNLAEVTTTASEKRRLWLTLLRQGQAL